MDVKFVTWDPEFKLYDFWMTWDLSFWCCMSGPFPSNRGNSFSSANFNFVFICRSLGVAFTKLIWPLSNVGFQKLACRTGSLIVSFCILFLFFVIFNFLIA